MTVAGIKTEVNLNTIAIVVGFLITFAGIVSTWTNIQNNQIELGKWIDAHDRVHDALNKQIESLVSDRATMLDLSFRLGANEKGLDAVQLRLNRMAENYGDQFTDIRTQLNSISTQVALTNQSIQRLVPPEPSR